MRLRGAVILALGSVLAATPNPVTAADLGQEDARQIEAVLRGWLNDLLGPGLTVPERPIELTPEGDHYRVLLPLPLAAPGGGDSGGAPLGITATAQPQPDGAWRIEQIRLPSPAKFTVSRANEAGGLDVYRVLVQVGEQDSRASFGPGLAAPAGADIRLGDFALGIEGPGGQRLAQHADRYTISAALEPSPGGRVNFVEDIVAENFSSGQAAPGSPPVATDARRVRLSGRINEVNPGRAGPVLAGSVHLMGSLLGVMSSMGAGSAPPSLGLDREAARALLLALSDIASGGRVQESVEDFRVKAGDVDASLKTAELEMTAAAPQDTLDASMTIRFDGLTIPGLPPPMDRWLPRRFVLHPTVAGVSVAELRQLAMAATEAAPDEQAINARIAALLGHGGVTVGVDPVAVEVGTARLEAIGKIALFSADRAEATATITGTGIEGLIASAKDDPALAPYLPLVRSMVQLAKRQNVTLVWDVAWRGGAVMVNGKNIAEPPSPSGAKPKPGSRR